MHWIMEFVANVCSNLGATSESFIWSTSIQIEHGLGSTSNSNLQLAKISERKCVESIVILN